jgi:hypothetical protein
LEVGITRFTTKSLNTFFPEWIIRDSSLIKSTELSQASPNKTKIILLAYARYCMQKFVLFVIKLYKVSELSGLDPHTLESY